MAGVDVQKPNLEGHLRTLKLSGHVGFDSLPDQLVSKSIQNGFIFNIMCIGETGLGKSTLMDSLFNTNFESTPSPHTLPTVKLKAHTYELQESNVRLKLTICDTVGYGDQINKDDSFKAVVDYIDTQFETYLQEELKIKRSLSVYHDTRIHICLYFICPTGHGLKSIDLVCMKKLDQKVNIIPIIAKADTISKTELQKFKSKIMAELQNNDVQIYNFPIDDESVSEINTNMNTHIPFAVIGSTDFIRVGNKMVRARQYPWGTVQVENESHCDFVKLREMLIRTNMEDMRDKTHCRHYELYRKRRLEQMGFSDVDSENKPISFQQTFENKRSNHLQELQQKEDEMRQMFVVRVKEKEAELKDAEKDLHAKFDKLKKEHTEEKKKIEEERKKLDDEIIEFNRRKVQYQQMGSSHHTLTLGKRVIWNSGKPTPGVKETFEKLKQCGKKIAFISNNNLYGTFGLYKNLTELYSGWEVEDVVVPAQAIIAYLKNKNFNKEVFIVGSASMKEEFAEAGLKVANKEISTTGSANDILQKLLKGDNKVGAVVFDYDIFINYLVLVQTSVLLKQEDIIFITGATDKKVVVGKNILLPGPHSFLNALLDVVDKTPLSFGKPSLNLTKFIESKYNIQDPSRVLFVGDSISQDIEFGSVSGYQTLFVLTGVSTLADVENTKNNHQVPNYFIDSLGSINELVENKLGI